jgi:hypothetical protein
MNTRRLFTVPLAVAALLAAAPLAAHFVPLTPAELVERSERIVVATVQEQSSRWKGNWIYTDTLLRVEDRLRGESPERFTISQLGGSIGDETQGTSLSVPLEPGERYLLFLADLDRPAPIVGGRQGAVRDISGFSGIVEEVRAYLRGESPDLRAIAAAAEEGLNTIHDRFVLRELAVPPIVFSPLPEDSPFSPHDQHQMAYWNAYHPDLFRVGPPTGLWSFGNGVFEIGFPDSLGGSGWPRGGTSAIVWRTRDGHIVEADIALNPAVPWTLDDDEATRPNGPHSFRESILGLLGKAWGLSFSFFQAQDSVLTLKPKELRLANLFADDTAAVRAAFGGTPIRDGLISSYYGFILSRPSVPVVRRGGSFKLMSPIKIENPGTEALINPQVEVYLVPRRFSMEKAVSLRRVRVQGTIPAGAVQRVVIGQVPVPRTVRPGVYYLAFRLLAAGDELPANDFAWSNYNVTLTVKAR